MKKLIYILLTISLISCGETNTESLIVKKVEVIKEGRYKYSFDGFMFDAVIYSSNVYQIGDTLILVPKRLLK